MRYRSCHTTFMLLLATKDSAHLNDLAYYYFYSLLLKNGWAKN